MTLKSNMSGSGTVVECETYEQAMSEAARLFDKGLCHDFYIVDDELVYTVQGYKLLRMNCPVCEEEVRQYQMERTCDCHGIPYRLVCRQCYERIMTERGFDGQLYTSADECIDYDY